MKISRALSIAPLIAALSVLAACDSARETPSQSPTASNAEPSAQATSGGTTAPATTTPGDDAPGSNAQTSAVARVARENTPTVRLIDPGKAPRRALRYAFKIGAPEWLEMDMKMAMSMTIGDQPASHVAMPTTRMLMKMEATDKTPEGNVRVAFALERASVLQDVVVPTAQREELAERISNIVGTHGHSTISPRGVASDADFELGSNVSDEVREMADNVRDAVRQVYAPLPEEEVGQGARWAITMKIPISGVTAQATTNYELAEVRNDSVRANVAIEIQAPPNQPMNSQRMPPGTTVILDSMSGKGDRHVNIALTRLVGGGKGRITTDAVMTVQAQNEIAHMTIHNVIEMITRAGKSPSTKNDATK
ncbi:MAG: DUF6263 family protein [Polyangiaceae bacterium]|nr:DUF6263 family protein [Polyangiaceae bacterium]